MLVMLLFKAYVHYFLSNFYFSLNDSPSKTTKNVFRKNFFDILQNERGQEAHGNYINGFSEKIII